MLYEVKNRFTGKVQFTADIDCADDAAESKKRGLAVLWAVQNGANLYGANLSEANLSGANLSEANLRGAKNIVSFGPVGNEGRICFAVKHEKDIMLKIGCFWGAKKEAIAKVSERYGKNSSYIAMIKAACKVLEGK